ncbi:MAG TPA: hypothetical protein ENI23_09495 [bacterium]|nr:hypothetical protein [bacterium]
MSKEEKELRESIKQLTSYDYFLLSPKSTKWLEDRAFVRLYDLLDKQRTKTLQEVREIVSELQYQTPLDILIVVDELNKKLKELEEGKE